jgi:hypothetical protein
LIEGYLTVTDTPHKYELWHFVKTVTFYTGQGSEPWVFGVSNDSYPPEPSSNKELSMYSMLNIVKVK